MKKCTSILLLLFIYTLTGHAQNRSIKFEHSNLKELIAKAQKEKKLIFIDAYTTWCGPCKVLAKQVFTNDTVADYYNANFINAKFDMEKGEGLDIAKQYSVSCYPSLLFIDGNGNLVHRSAGSMSTNLFTALGKTAKDDSKNFSYYVKNYTSKKSDTEFLMNYIDAMNAGCMDPANEVVQYFSLQKEKDLLSETNWKMIDRYTDDLDSREFKFLIDNKSKLNALHTEKAVDEKIADVAGSNLYQIIKTKPFDKAKYDLTKQKIMKLCPGSGPKIIFEADLSLAKKTKDWKAYTELALASVDSYYSNDESKLNSVAWDFYENTDDKTALLKAEAWAKQSTEIKPEYGNMDTYASLLYKNGKKDLAMATAQKAIEYAKQENYSADEYKSTSELLDKIKTMK